MATRFLALMFVSVMFVVRKKSAGSAAADADGSSHAFGECRGVGRSAEGDEDRVVAADGAENAVDGGGVDGAGHRLRAGDDRADDDEVAAGIDAGDEFSDGLIQPR